MGKFNLSNYFEKKNAFSHSRKSAAKYTCNQENKKKILHNFVMKRKFP